MNTMKDILTVCGIAGIGMFFGYVLGFVEGKVEGRNKGYTEGVTYATGKRNSSVEGASAHPSCGNGFTNQM